MRALLQRCTGPARVEVDDRVVGAIERGLVVLLGVEDGDDDHDLAWLVGKVARQRLFADQAGRMNCDVAAIGGGFLVVSQFTLLASTRKGNRPGFVRAALPAVAEARYELFCASLAAESGCPVERGHFAAHMRVHLVNDGPVTVLIDSRLRE